MLVLHDPDTLLHSTVEILGAKLIPALESPDRLHAILKSLDTSHHEVRTIQLESSQNLLEAIKKTHDPGYLKHIETVFDSWLAASLVSPTGSVLPECFRLRSTAQPNPQPPKDIFARAGYYAFDMSTGITSTTYSSTIASANLAYTGTNLLLAPSPTRHILALTRPPGHHCDGARAGGYCYLNNAALAITTYLAARPGARTALLDIDFHHGNGTQEIFYAARSPLYVSIHGEDEFPYYTGSADETGTGDGDGFNLNLPLKTGASAEEYLTVLDVALKRLAEYNAEFVVVSLGFDTFYLDPLGKFGLETDDYEVIARRVAGVLGGVQVLIVLEGGYVLEHLGANLLSFLKGWEEGGMESAGGHR